MRVPSKAALGVLSACALVVSSPGPVGMRAATPAAAATVAVPVVATAACSDVLVLAVPGNGQGPTARAPRSAGATLDRFVTAFSARSVQDQRSVSTSVVATDTAPARTLAPRNSAGRRAAAVVSPRRVRAWQGAPWRLAGRVESAAAAAADRCPQQQLVLAGYSQGAMAVHRSLLALVDRPSVLDRVTSVVLIGDGDRRSGTAAPWIVGDPRAWRSGQGVVPRYLRAVGDVPTPSTTTYLWQVCTRGDVVCDIRNLSFGESLARHGRYASGTGGSRVAGVAQAAWDRATRWPLTVPATVSATAGRAVQPVALTVRVRAADRPAVRWGDVTGLPAGMRLDDRGQLSGTPAKPGSYTVGYTVRNTSDPAVSRPVPGTLVITVAEPPAPTTPTSAAVTSGGAQSCDIGGDGVLRCWGANPYGQLGDGTTTGRRYPAPVSTATDWTSVSTSGSTTCGVRAGGRAYCWGLNQWGQLGDGTRTKRLRPTPVAGGSWERISAGWFHTCGVKTDGSAWCWGWNDAGQLGDGSRTTRWTPVRVAGGGSWRDISVGGFDTCGVKTDGTAWCWGRNMFGELALSGYVSKEVPQRIGTATDWTSVQASWNHTCGLRAGGAAYCWGKNDRGQRGDGTRRTTAAVTPVAGDRRFTSLSVGDTHTCGIDTAARMWCWGYNRYGQFGTGARGDSLVPVAAAGTSTWRHVDAGWQHVCGVTSSGSTRCWGANTDGQLGDGTATDRLTPTDLYRGDPA